jgi:hypothetical protein
MVKVLTRLNIKAKKSTEFNIPCFFYASGKVKRVNHKLMTHPHFTKRASTGSVSSVEG